MYAKRAISAILKLLPKTIQADFKKNTVLVYEKKYYRGPQNQYIEIKGEYCSITKKIFLYDIRKINVDKGLFFYYYAHECGHKYLEEFISGADVKELFKIMSSWSLSEKEYREYRAVKILKETFSDVFALFLRAKHYQAMNQKEKMTKIKKTMHTKTPHAWNFIEKSFKKTLQKEKSKEEAETYPVTQADFERLERVFGKNIF